LGLPAIQHRNIAKAGLKHFVTMQTRRRDFLKTLVAAGLAPGLSWPDALQAQTTGSRTPVILATDIGDDIDDTWALGLLLKSPELDLKLVVGEYGKPQYRAKLLAKFLQTVNHSEVPIGMGMDSEPKGEGPQAEWIKDYKLDSYPGKIHQDGVQAIIDTILNSQKPITIISIGPMPNVAAALTREPKIAGRARLVGMYGSVRKGYDGSAKISPEWNVKADAKACQTAFKAPWEITITPLDTCGIISLDGARYQRVRNSKDRIASTIIENYRLWSKANHQSGDPAEKHSSTLFDTVAVYLAISQQLCKMEHLGIEITDDGFTKINPSGKIVNVATEWTNLDAFRDFLVTRLTS
jgi:inosine-uridine nucleoside N-ribohydrolase